MSPRIKEGIFYQMKFQYFFSLGFVLSLAGLLKKIENIGRKKLIHSVANAKRSRIFN